MDTPEPGSAAEDEEEKVPDLRPRTRSNPEGAEDRAASGQPGLGGVASGLGSVASGLSGVASGLGGVGSGLGSVASGLSGVGSGLGSVASGLSGVASGLSGVGSGLGSVGSVGSVVSGMGSGQAGLGSGVGAAVVSGVASGVGGVVSGVGGVASGVGGVASGVGTVASGVGSRSEGEGEADHSPQAGSGHSGPAWPGPAAHAAEVQVKTPRVNCPEKVIICLDLAEEMAVPKLESFNGSRSNALTVSQKMIEMFVRTKHKIDKSHEFALVVVNNDATWLSGFTSDPREVCSCLYDLDTVVCQSFNLEGLFNLIQQKIELPVTDNVQTIPPPFVVRTILVFGRPPGCQPQFCGGEHVKKLLQCPYFFFDVVYIHNGLEDKEDDSSWKDMFGFFGSLDTKGTNYKYEVALAGPALELHNCMAKLLAHPLQRPCQSHAAYALLDDGDSADCEATV